MTAEQVAAALQCSTQDLGELVRRGLVRYLGHPAPQNAVKWFARVEIEDLAVSRDFLDKMTRAIYRYHTQRNQQVAKMQKQPRKCE